MDRDAEDVGEDGEEVPDTDERLAIELAEGDDGLLDTGGLDNELDWDVGSGVAEIESVSPVVVVAELDTADCSPVSAGVLGEDAVLVDVSEEAGDV